MTPKVQSLRAINNPEVLAPIDPNRQHMQLNSARDRHSEHFIELPQKIEPIERKSQSGFWATEVHQS